MNRDSWNLRGNADRPRRPGRGCGLYLTWACWRVAGTNPVPWAVLPPFPGSGQGQKHAPTVCMRKLLIILNAAVQSGGRWSQLGGRNYLKTWRDTLFVIPAEAGIQSPGGREALSPTTEDRHAPLPAISLHLTLSGAGIQNLGKHHLAFQKNQCVLR